MDITVSHTKKVHTGLTSTQQAEVGIPALTPPMPQQFLQFLQWKKFLVASVYLGSMRIFETQHLALLIKNLSFKCNGMHTLWYCASIWRKIKVEQLISYTSIFSKETWHQAVKTRNPAMEIQCSHLQKIVQAATSQQCKETDWLLMHIFYQLLHSDFLSEHAGSILWNCYWYTCFILIFYKPIPHHKLNRS